MSVKIGPPCSPKFASTFVCEIETMDGDGDAFETIELPIRRQQIRHLDKLLDVIKRISDEAYHLVPGLGRFFNIDGEWIDDWPRNHDVGCFYIYQSHRFVWYSPTGRKHQVEVDRQ